MVVAMTAASATGWAVAARGGPEDYRRPVGVAVLGQVTALVVRATWAAFKAAAPTATIDERARRVAGDDKDQKRNTRENRVT